MRRRKNRTDRVATRTAAALKAIEAVKLRVAGCTLDEIATRIGYAGRGAVHKAITRHIAQADNGSTEQLRDIENHRLDRLLLAVWSKAMTGDEKAVDRALKIHERRVRMNGLALEPVPVTNVQVNVGVDLQTRFEQLRKMPATELARAYRVIADEAEQVIDIETDGEL